LTHLENDTLVSMLLNRSLKVMNDQFIE